MVEDFTSSFPHPIIYILALASVVPDALNLAGLQDGVTGSKIVPHD